MALNIVFRLHALSAAPFAFLLLFFPAQLAGWLSGGVYTDPTGIDLARLYGLTRAIPVARELVIADSSHGDMDAATGRAA